MLKSEFEKVRTEMKANMKVAETNALKDSDKASKE